METEQILKDLGARAGGEVYLGVVGPVRTGKSTFIRRFMETIVLEKIIDEDEKKRATDELPQAGTGKTIMTVEPKFVPAKAVNIKVTEKMDIRIRLIDCVGYLINNATGFEEDKKMRLVKTPWFSEAIPFDEAAKIGTEKVIKEHSTIGIVVLSDGTVTDFSRQDYLEAEMAIIKKMHELKKPFVIVLNSKMPGENKTEALRDSLMEQYQAPVVIADCEHFSKDTATEILYKGLLEFPISSVALAMPSWVDKLPDDHYVKISINQSLEIALTSAQKVKDVELISQELSKNDYASGVNLSSVDTGSGLVTVQFGVKEEFYDQIIKELIGVELTDKGQLLEVLATFTKAKRDYDLLGPALEMANETGYGFVSAPISNMKIDKPELFKSNGRSGVKIKASTPTYHLIKVDLASSFEPILGSKEQADYFINSLLDVYEKDPMGILDFDLFGQKFGDVLKGSIGAKLRALPEPVKIKLIQLIKTVANRGKGNLIAFVF